MSDRAIRPAGHPAPDHLRHDPAHRRARPATHPRRRPSPGAGIEAAIVRALRAAMALSMLPLIAAYAGLLGIAWLVRGPA